ncbi:MAG: malate dehydrogenase (quinone) [Edaphobacter sp.]|uniref:malate dehydrogenase (quinone) n=1 Tax=Edaphobacter sp. TaxID=1934404 RepID=UPI00239586BF|nr:malate dehydrogenase (quinone) [Edaphobacter sp.]MDE1175646.1 malate dehydrogenase (quinone) [Edaphobacter sp.]
MGIGPGEEFDVVLIGAGIMSATLGTLLKQLAPELSIAVFESRDRVASESSEAWNNAGTGHAALCELNYTPEKADGSVTIEKAIKINEQFQESLAFWTYLVEQGRLGAPEEFIRRVPHMSFVWGEKNAAFLRARYEAMSRNPLFRQMQFTQDARQIGEWAPLLMDGRSSGEMLAATKVDRGTDVNFGSLTRKLLDGFNGSVYLEHRVLKLERESDGRWCSTVMDERAGVSAQVRSRFVFIGSGGAALLLLQNAKLKAGAGYGGFPVSGQWLRCVNPQVIERHGAKVYGKASVGAPPMSVPHLDTRMIDGKRELLFGPFAGFSTKFLKSGSYLDLVKSVQADNLYPLIKVGIDNVPLTKYLIGEVMQSPEDRLKSLQTFMPTARMEDWKLEIAGQRVQIIKPNHEKGGVLEFGTEVIREPDGSIAALLGASPGASTAVSIMLGMIAKGINVLQGRKDVAEMLRAIVPSAGRKLVEETALLEEITARSNAALKLG